MKKFLLLLVPTLALAQPLPPPTTTYTRDLLRAANSNEAWLVLGLAPTNSARLTNVITDAGLINSGTLLPARIPYVNTNAATSNSPGVMSSNSVSQLRLDPLMRRKAAAKIPQFLQINSQLSTEADVILYANQLNSPTNGLTRFGFDTIMLNCSCFNSNRSGGQLMLNTTQFPMGVTNLVAALATNNCKLGVFIQVGPGDLAVDECGNPVVTPATAFADGYRIASWGIAQVWIGEIWRTIPSGNSMDAVRYTLEQFAAGLDTATRDFQYQNPVFLECTWSSTYNTNRPYAWASTILNGVYANYFGGGNDPISFGAYGMQRLFLDEFTVDGVRKNQQSVTTGVGLPMKSSTADTAIWMTTNYTKAFIGAICMQPTVYLINGFPNPEEALLIRNQSAIEILQDSERQFGQIVSSNVSAVVIKRKLTGGDFGLLLWNLDTNATGTVSYPVNQVFPGTNVCFALDVFAGGATAFTNTVSSLINTGGVAFYRLSMQPFPKGSGLGLTTNLLDWTGTNALVFKDGLFQGYTPTNALPVTSGLVAWWKLKEGDGYIAYDSSGNRNDGILEVPLPYWTNQAGVSALYFNGNTSVKLPDTASLNVVGAMSMSAWSVPEITNTLTFNHWIIGGFNNGNNHGYGLSMYWGNDGGPGYGSGFSEGTYTYGNQSLTNRGWVMHTVVLRADLNAVFYLNATPIKTNSVSALPTSYKGVRRLGAWAQGDNYYWKGPLSNVRIYGREITTNEVYSLYLQGP